MLRTTWSFDRSRHFVRFATYVKRDPIFRDLFVVKLARRAAAPGPDGP